MILIIGGAYQGKLPYVIQEYQKEQSDIHTCCRSETKIPPDKKVIYHFEEWLLACVRSGPDGKQRIAAYLNTLSDEIIICEDISCGLVPVDRELRSWRETVGTTLTAISLRADRVIRLFCGIATILKGEEKDEIKN